MKYIALVIVFGIVAVFGYDRIISYVGSRNIEAPLEEIVVSGLETIEGTTTDNSLENANTVIPEREVIAENLTIPWDIAFLPDHTMLVTERDGSVVHIGEGRTYEVSGVEHVGEGGLLGIAVHPDFSDNHYIYLYQTTRTDDGLKNRVVRYTFRNTELTFDRVLFSGIPGAAYHDGGRIDFGPDGLLYITTGDAGMESSAQDTGSLAGKILRIEDDGSLPENPFGTAVYSYGHRNPQGLAWDEEGRLWSTEHGRSGLRSGFDELNVITAGHNYGWPQSEGDTAGTDTRAPAAHSGSDDTWAPGSALYFDGSIFFGGLRGEALYEAVLDGETVVEIREHLRGEYGRIRTVVLGPDGAFYLTTSNRDGRGEITSGDDKIIRLNPSQFRRD